SRSVRCSFGFFADSYLNQRDPLQTCSSRNVILTSNLDPMREDLVVEMDRFTSAGGQCETLRLAAFCVVFPDVVQTNSGEITALSSMRNGPPALGISKRCDAGSCRY